MSMGRQQKIHGGDHLRLLVCKNHCASAYPLNSLGRDVSDAPAYCTRAHATWTRARNDGRARNYLVDFMDSLYFFGLLVGVFSVLCALLVPLTLALRIATT